MVRFFEPEMNTVISLFERQCGNGRWFGASYDPVLAEVGGERAGQLEGISPSTMSADFNPSPPVLAAKFAKCAEQEHILAIANEDGKVAIQDTNLRNEESGGERALGRGAVPLERGV
ncbi:hypothetical protein quinque_004428 [Culex quinquefasciatus]